MHQPTARTRRILCLAALALLAGCAAPEWRAVATPGTPCCTGTLVAHGANAAGDRELRLRPRAKDAALLAPGQELLVCHLGAREVERFAAVLARLEVGKEYEVCGYLVCEARTGMHQIRPITSIDPFPDPR